MAWSKNLPTSVVRLGTYSELEHYARAFAEGHLNLVMVCGAPGLGKSDTFRRAVGGNVGWINGHASALGIYLLAYEHRNQPIVLDDIDGLDRDNQGIGLLKALCQTDTVKSVSWHTKVATRAGLDIPRQFTTTSRIAILANQWKALNADVAALQDRGHCLAFTPSALEVHRQAARWFWDVELFDFIGAHLHLIQQHSLRTYVLAWELKKAGLDWRQAVLCRSLTGAFLEVAKLRSHPGFASEEERVKAFVAAGHGCRATYFNYVRKLQPPEAPTPIPLLQSSPPEPTQPSTDILDIFRRRFGPLGNG
jgi:hypothetical protein